MNRQEFEGDYLRTKVAEHATHRLLNLLNMKNISVLFALTNASCNTCNHSVINLMIAWGAALYNYLWSKNATTEEISGLLPATYNVRVTGRAEITLQHSTCNIEWSNSRHFWSETLSKSFKRYNKHFPFATPWITGDHQNCEHNGTKSICELRRNHQWQFSKRNWSAFTAIRKLLCDGAAWRNKNGYAMDHP